MCILFKHWVNILNMGKNVHELTKTTSFDFVCSLFLVSLDKYELNVDLILQNLR